MKLKSLSRVLILFSTPFLCTYEVRAQTNAPVIGVLDDLIATGIANNPGVAAAYSRWLRAGAERDAVDGFFDPVLQAGGGRHEGPTAIPATTRGAKLSGGAYALQGGIETALSPGAYVSLGAAERRLIDNNGNSDNYYQTVAGVRVDIPLLRNRGFSEWRSGQSQATYESRRHRWLLLHTIRALRRDIASTYVDALLAKADEQESRNAAERVEALLKESRQRVALNVLPEYQVHSASMEVALRREEQRSARQLAEIHAVRLEQLVGSNIATRTYLDVELLAYWAQLCNSHTQTVGEVLTICERRGDFRAIKMLQSAAMSGLELLTEQEKSELLFSVSAGWQGESEDSALGTDDHLTDPNFGSEVALTWRRPLGRTRERALIRAQHARIRELHEQLRAKRLEIAAEVSDASTRLNGARERLAYSMQAMEGARLALDAERQRFRLGEGRSRNVLDAQKDLTAAIRRRNRAAADLIRANIDMDYAAVIKTRPELENITKHTLEAEDATE